MKGRYAPSPTGALHLGNLRTALAAWLLARSQGSGFALRVEDLDPDRSRPEYERAQVEDLRAIGLDWDPPVLHQSERGALYRAALDDLRALGRVYPCWCTRAEVREAALAPHEGTDGGRYPGTCRGLSEAERERRERERGRPPAWRLDSRGEVTSFLDRIHGPVEGAVDDFVVWRGDGVAAYNLAVVLDDAEQGIEEVVRGDDLLRGTLRQILLARLLGIPSVRYAHLPLVLGADGRRLSKRAGAVTLAQRRARGESVRGVVGWMAWSLGLTEGPREMTASEALFRFDLARISDLPTILGRSRLTREGSDPASV